MVKKFSLLLGGTLLSVCFISALLDNLSFAALNEKATSIQIPSALSCSCNKGYGDLVEKLLPAVVNISTTGMVEISVSPLEQMFGFGMIFPFMGQEMEGNDRIVKRKSNVLGSGFLVSEDGYIITNYHVIKDAEEIIITTNDKEEHPGKVIGFDKKMDIALIKVNSEKKFSFAKFGDSDKSRIGDIIIAIGNPFGLGGTVTAGIISAKARHIGEVVYGDLIQTDAAINVGNSGGPMFNTSGEVVGVNTAIYAPNGAGNIGIGFAIPSNLITPILEQLKDNKKIKYSWVGIVYRYVDKNSATAVGLKEAAGVLINDIVPDSPASKAGIKIGDIILKIDNQVINKNTYIPNITHRLPVGEKINVTLWRYGKEITLPVILGEQPEAQAKDKAISKNSKGRTEAAGISVVELTDDLKSRLKIDKAIEGVVILNVGNQIILDEDILHKGDIILQVNETPVKDPDEFIKAVTASKVMRNKHAIFHIHRRGNTFLQGVKIYE